MDLAAIQSALQEQKLDGWLFYDHHHRDPIAERILGMPPHGLVSRRWYYLIPAAGEPQKLVHRIEAGRLDALPGEKHVYSSWQELELQLEKILSPYVRIAMQYSPRNAIMYVSMVDAGTVELVRGMGKEVVSSADLVSRFEAVLSEEQIATHYAAQQRLDKILEAGFKELGDAARSGTASEFGMMTWLREAMQREGLEWEHGPNVSVNANSADSHYDPTYDTSQPIGVGDFVLIDIWAKLDGVADAVWYDITWTGVVGRGPSAREQHVFEAVRDARDAAVHSVQAAFAAGRPIAGWQPDDAARAVIVKRGYGEWFTHRTGHNIATELHGNGANLDNLETHDERLILPYTCFSVEPGIYLPVGDGQFGIRSEVNMLTHADRAEVTGRIQRELVRI
jgi:Xaa-Pro aminopeptidase